MELRADDIPRCAAVRRPAQAVRDTGPSRRHRPVDLSRVANQMSGAADSLPLRADEKVSIEPSLLMNGRASNAGELRSCMWTA